ncbi:hypothetical protein BJX70DRAFT_364610 [Aspergillus crustosus]
MSSVWKCVPNHSMAGSLRAAQHIRSRSFRKGCPYSTSFHPIATVSLNPPIDDPNQAPNFYSTDAGDPSTCEFWCSSRLTWSRLNKQSLPLKVVAKPWGSLSERENGTLGANLGPKPLLKRSRIKYGKRPDPPEDGSPIGSGMSPSKRVAPTSSEYLIDTLQDKALSGAHSGSWTLSGTTSQKPIQAQLTLEQRQEFKRAYDMSLREILADYIQFVDPILEKWNEVDVTSHARAGAELDYALAHIARGEFISFLESRQYDITDVVAWAWIAKSNTAYEAAIRIFLLEADRAADKSTSRRRVPYFIPSMLLRRKDLDLKTFRLLSICSLYLITGQPLPRLNYSLQVDSESAAFDESSYHGRAIEEPKIPIGACASIVGRLLSHARRLWPEMQLPITQAFAFYLRTAEFDDQHTYAARLLNMCLYQISLPPGPRPFVSVSVRQQAQFDLLRAMAERQPALPVTRLGYRGLASLQLAHKKTTAEREFAELKAQSWPPWEETRAGIDSDKGLEGVKSRAKHVLGHMTEAGYPDLLWEQTLGILAGWDTDNSPTIQTRTLMRASGFWTREAKDENHHAIWAARIEATRTVREAWACFMAYESQEFPPHAKVYAAMATKLISIRKVTKVQRRQSSIALPGDGLEIYPEPASARDWIYTPTEPPTLGTFLERMLSEGFRPSGRLLASLLLYAPTFEVGIDCLNCSDMSNRQLRVLLNLTEDSPETDPEYQKALDEIPEYIFGAFIHFVSRFSRLTERRRMNSPVTPVDAFPIVSNTWRIKSKPATIYSFTSRGGEWKERSWYLRLLSHAIRLLRMRDSSSTYGWDQLLKRLCSNRVPGADIRRHTQVVLAWYEVMEVNKWMDKRNLGLGTEGFLTLCESFSAAVMARVKMPNALDSALISLGLDETRPESAAIGKALSSSLEDMVGDGLILLKRQFDSLILLDPKTSPLFESLKSSLEEQTESRVTLPGLPHVPPPVLLHAFVRALGAAEDSDGLLNLLRWMKQHALTLNQLSAEYTDGKTKTRRVIVAMRIFLEGYWNTRSRLKAKEFMSDSDPPVFSDPAVQEAYDIVEASEIWGPWPSDEEVRDYFDHFKRKIRQKI